MRQSARFDDSAYTPAIALLKACKTAIDHGNTYTDIKADKWAKTYRCSTEDVKHAWEKAAWEQTQQPQNSYDVEGK